MSSVLINKAETEQIPNITTRYLTRHAGDFHALVVGVLIWQITHEI